MNYGYVYKTTNLINNKIYIGQHKWTGHEIDPKYLGSGKILKEAIKTYGKENFKCEILEWCESFDELNKRERYWEKFHGLPDPKREIGYNITIGGQGVPGYQFTKEDRQKISKKSKDRKWVYKDGINKFVKLDELKEYLDTGWTLERRNINLRPVICLETEQIWDSIAYTEDFLQVARSTLKNYIDRIPYRNGLHYCYLDTYKKMSKAEQQEFLLKPFPVKEKAIICTTTGQVFKSMREASQILGVSQGQISLICNGHVKQTKGYQFKFYEE
jgi:group I intron endonuclease